jgi:transcriptional regulator with XRE-family HTH domain
VPTARAKPSDKPKKKPAARVHFGFQLRAAREALELSQEAFGEVAGVHRTFVGQVERAEKNLSIESMEKLAKAVKRPMWELLRPF